MSISKLQNIVSRARPLMDWYAKNKPEVKHLALSAADYRLLLECRALVPHAGIRWDGKEFSYQGFRLDPPPGFDEKES